jgi:hypothetical protein
VVFVTFFAKKVTKTYKPHRLLAVCYASRIKPQKTARKAVFYLINCVRSPLIVVFKAFLAKKALKTYKCNRLLEQEDSFYH